MKYIFFIPIVLLLLSCAAATFQPYYKDVKPQYDLLYRVNTPLVIAVQDRRPYVLSGNKTEFFYGLVRSVYGIPHTINGQVSAANNLLLLSRLLLSNENKSNIYTKEISLNLSGIDEAKKISNNKILLYMQLFEWKTDMPAIGTGMMWYDVSYSIYGKKGNLLLSGRISGKDSMLTPQRDESNREFKNSDNLVRWYQKARTDALGRILLNPKVIKVINMK